MNETFQRLRRNALWQACIFLALGLFIWIQPQLVFDLFIYLVSGYLLLTGIVRLISQMRMKRKGYVVSLVPAALYIAFAIIVFLFAEGLASVLPVFLGILFFFSGVSRLVQAITMREVLQGRWLIFLLYSILLLVAGFLLVTNPFSSLLLLFQIFGVLLIATAIFEFIIFFTVRDVK